MTVHIDNHIRGGLKKVLLIVNDAESAGSRKVAFVFAKLNTLQYARYL